MISRNEGNQASEERPTLDGMVDSGWGWWHLASYLDLILDSAVTFGLMISLLHPSWDRTDVKA